MDVGDGHNPYAGLTFDGAGNLYGTTALGGTGGGGTVFQLIPQLGGGWYERVLYAFQNNTQDGNSPYAGLVIDAAGNLYGTTQGGGSGGSCQGNGCGTVYELSPKAGGSWVETVLHRFQENGTDGNEPFAGLTFDTTGNLYGTTTLGGANLVGIVFGLSPRSSGNWHERVLHTFQRGMTDGFEPYAGVILDSSGNLYGTTMFGGDSKNLERGGPVAITPGTVFEVTP